MVNRALTKTAAVCLLVLAAEVLQSADGAGDPLAFFQPSFVTTAKERKRLDRGDPVVRILPATGNTVAVLAAIPVSSTSDRLADWVRNITTLKKTQRVEASGRFSDPPRLADFSTLTFDAVDLTEVRECRPGDCDLKLSAPEIADVRRAVAAGATQAALQDTLRHLLLQRVSAYVSKGHVAMPCYHDKSKPLSSADTFASLVGQMHFFTQQLPQVSRAVVQWPVLDAAPLAETESYIYWSKDRVGNKAIVSATQLFILRGDGNGRPDPIVIGKQIFATHYLDGSIDLTTLVGGGDGSPRYLVYVNRTSVDMLSGFLGGLVRHAIEGTVSDEAPNVLRGVRRRLEQGAPEAR